jgi:hypothetical protein
VNSARNCIKLLNIFLILAFLAMSGCTGLNKFIELSGTSNMWHAYGIESVRSDWQQYDFYAFEAAEFTREGIYDPAIAKEWKDQGFTAKEAILWLQEADDDSYRHNIYEYARKTNSSSTVVISAASARLWKEAGFLPDVVQTWHKYGFMPSEVDVWKMCSPQNALNWKNAGFSANEVKDWEAVSFGLGEAARWHAVSFTPTEAVEWQRVGFIPEHAKLWKEQKLTLSEVSNYAGLLPEEVDYCKRESMNIADFKGWKAVGFSGEKAKDWSTAKFDLADAKAWRDAGFSATEARSWKGAQFFLEPARSWKDAIFSLDEASSWNNRKFNVTEAQEWRKCGFTAEDAWQWENSGFTSKQAKEWKDSGWSLEGVKSRRALIKRNCSSSIEGLFDLLRSNPYDVEGRCFYVFGAPLQILDRTTALYKAYNEVYFVDFGNESVPMTFFEGIVKGQGVYQYITVAGVSQIVPMLKVFNIPKQ